LVASAAEAAEAGEPEEAGSFNLLLSRKYKGHILQFCIPLSRNAVK
jgi:hypothetical protein